MGAPSAGGRLVGGRYRLEEPLGRGGMGVVWRGRDELLGRAVAVKEVLLPPGLSVQERDVLYQRTLREARAAARLDHPNVVLVYDVVEEDGRPWIVMELVRARSLGQVIREEGPLPPHRVTEIGRHVLAALRAAHGAGVLHRDVKPSNVLLADDGRVVLTDFGIAAVEGDATLTGTGTLLGSPAYIAPERARGVRATAASDLWALGATLYTAVEGRPPHDRGTAMATLTAVVTEQPDPMRRAGPLRPVIEGLLHKDPGERMAAGEVERLLGEIAVPATGERPEGAEEAPAQHADQDDQDDQDDIGATPAGGGADAPREEIEQTRVSPLPASSEPEPPAPPQPAVEPPSAVSSEPVEPAATAEPPGPPAGGPAQVRPATPAGEPTRRRRLALLTGVCALVVATGAAVGGFLLRDEESPASSPPAASSPTGRAAGPPDATAAPSPANSSPGRAAGPPDATDAPSPTGRSQELPEGFHRYRDPTGFSVAVPDDWLLSRDGPRVRFQEPHGGRFLIIDQTDDPKPDPVADWEQQEEARRDTYPGYRRIRIAAVDYQRKAADWEFTYTGRSGRIHVLNRGFVTGPDQAYAIYWSTPEDQWEASLDYFEVFTDTFTPAT